MLPFQFNKEGASHSLFSEKPDMAELLRHKSETRFLNSLCYVKCKYNKILISLCYVKFVDPSYK